MIRIFAVEDHPVIVTGIRNTFRPSRDGIEITGSAGNPDEAIEKADTDTFDIIFLDLIIPGFNPIQNVNKLKNAFPGKPIIMFTSEDSSTWRKKMYEAGVKAYLLKSAEKHEIKNTVEKVSQGITVLSARLEPGDAGIISSFSDPKYNVTDNQKDIVLRLSQGQSQQEIADIKNTSISNIEKTLKHIREKTGARNNPELIRIMLERGVI